MSYTYDTWWSPNTNGGGYAKEGVCIHHAATTDFDGIGRTFQDTARQTSAHYGVEPGHVCQYLDDGCNAWATSTAYGNNSFISVECVNSGGEAEGWPVAEETIDTLVEWLADKSREHGFGHYVVGQNLRGHKDFSATFCPGVLYDRLEEIAERANAIIDGEDEDMIRDEDIARIWAYHYDGDSDGWDCYTKLREAAKHTQYHESAVEGGDGGDTRTRIDYIDSRVKRIDGEMGDLRDQLQAVVQKLDTVLGKL